MNYTLTTPLAISPALTPGLMIGPYWLTLWFTGRNAEGRVTTDCEIFGVGETIYKGEGPSSGCGEVADDQLLRELFESAIMFLMSDAEAYEYAADQANAEYSCNAKVAEWAYQNANDLDYARWDLMPESDD